MHPDWLRSVVWAFGDRPDVDVLYGAVIVQYGNLDDGHRHTFLPHVNLLPWSRELLERQAITDHGAVAHRAGLDEAHFVELPAARDWEMMLRLTRSRSALALAAVALMYYEDGHERVSDEADYAAIQGEIANAHGLPEPIPYLSGRRALLLRISELEVANAEQSAALQRLSTERDALVRERQLLLDAGTTVTPIDGPSRVSFIRRLGASVRGATADIPGRRNAQGGSLGAGGAVSQAAHVGAPTFEPER